jgi:hypothetical protein
MERDAARRPVPFFIHARHDGRSIAIVRAIHTWPPWRAAAPGRRVGLDGISKSEGDPSFDRGDVEAQH